MNVFGAYTVILNVVSEIEKNLPVVGLLLPEIPGHDCQLNAAVYCSNQDVLPPFETLAFEEK